MVMKSTEKVSQKIFQKNTFFWVSTELEKYEMAEPKIS